MSEGSNGSRIELKRIGIPVTVTIIILFIVYFSPMYEFACNVRVFGLEFKCKETPTLAPTASHTPAVTHAPTATSTPVPTSTYTEIPTATQTEEECTLLVGGYDPEIWAIFDGSDYIDPPLSSNKPSLSLIGFDFLNDCELQIKYANDSEITYFSLYRQIDLNQTYQFEITINELNIPRNSFGEIHIWNLHQI